MTKPDLRDAIRAALARDPQPTQVEIATELGVSQQRVAQVMQEMGYRKLWQASEE